MRRKRVSKQGQGRTVNLSSHGILFPSAYRFKAGSYVELSITLPGQFETGVISKLNVFGRIVRTDKNACAVKVARRTLGTQLENEEPYLTGLA